MKIIGLIGGMSWESSQLYYQIINETVKERLGGLHSAQCLLWSFDFAEIEHLQAAGDWQAATQRMIDAAQALERGGADCLVICTNTMHRMADEVQQAVAAAADPYCRRDGPGDPVSRHRDHCTCWAHVTRWSRISTKAV